LIPALQEVLIAIPQDEVAKRCERANVSWANVGKPGDLFTDPHLLATGGLVDVIMPRKGDVEAHTVGLPALPIQFGGGARPTVTRQPPRMGEHNAEVLAEAGYSAKEIATLAESGVIVSAA
jgi:crotonobetainyl-CoA:carnitine CoA-transferase CaiB-like acyl-CoA transferase